MLISIGILAWNEEREIERALGSLLSQSAFQGADGDSRGWQLEVVIVPNGCTDNTASVSRRFLTERVGQISPRAVSWRVCELFESGKSNAWNRFVHEFSSREAELIALMDADIEFGEPNTLARTVSALLSDPRALAAVDLPLKDAVKKSRLSPLERVSLLSSGSAAAGRRPEICGQFFVAKASALRRIWMPKGLPVEDGFLGGMLRTNCFLDHPDDCRIIRAPGATHYFQTLTGVGSIFRHELRLVMGTALNCYLMWDFLLFATDPRGDGAGELIHRQLDRDPTWFERLVANSIRNHGWWTLPRGMLLRRFSTVPPGSLTERSKWLLLALLGFLFDIPVFLVANRRIKRLHSIGYW